MASGRGNTRVPVGLISILGAGILVLLALAPVKAGAAVLHDQVGVGFPNSIISQDFEPAFDDRDAMAADDFVVPEGKVWRLEEAFIRGKHQPGGDTFKATQARVTIFSDNAGLPGNEVSSGLMAIKPDSYPNIRPILDPQPVLSSGTYWIGVQVPMNATTDDTLNNRNWFWAENNTAFGNPAVFRNPGDGFGTGCVTFTPRNTCGNLSEAAHPAPDQSFNLSGSESDASAPPVEVTPDPGCKPAKRALAKRKAGLRKAKKKLKNAKGKARKAKAARKVKKAKKSTDKAKAKVRSTC